ncbi:MAG: acyltransferase [Enterobacterales bacterium]|nr:acyltransferase [Enterobacterales bacterium]
MLRFLPAPLKGILISLFYGINTIFWTIPILVFALLKLIIPWTPWRKICSWAILIMADAWIIGNVFMIHQLNRFEIKLIGEAELETNDWYLVIANHQSWVDILAIQEAFRGKIPFLKFFLKQELIYIPFLGLAWWALDFPFMKRYSKSTLKKKPHLRGKDIETTREACEKFKYLPISVVNFVEGTRYTDEKSARQGDAYQHLLRPRSGGIGYVMTMLGEQIHYILNLTIHYPNGKMTYWDYVTGRINKIEIHIKSIEVDDSLRGNYIEDSVFRASFQTWLTAQWQEKDVLLKSLHDKR